MTDEFNEPSLNVIRSRDGWTVEVLGRTGLRYADGERVMRVSSEIAGGPAGMIVYSASITRWMPPHESEPITSEVRERIVTNLRRAFAFRGLQIDVL